jgi:HSP20 family protein
MTVAPRSEGPLTLSVEKLRHELDRWLDAAWVQGERAMETIGLRGRAAWTPPIDVLEDQESVRVLINLPGVAPSDIDLMLTGNMLTVSGVLPAIDVLEREERHAMERPTGAFRRSIPLPAGVDPNTVSAESRQGVLIVMVAKTEREKSRKIPIRATAPASSPTV